MTDLNIELKVAAHYARNDLTARILNTLGQPDAKPGDLTIERLARIDQLHHGGLSLTERLAQVAGVERGWNVLDAGSGIGAGARYLADRFDCKVDALDLSADFVATAGDLDVLVGLSEKITQSVGSVTDLPYDDGQFDLVWSQNVTMNIADKPAMFAEALRVLRLGGVFALTHIAAREGAAIDYPLPWAMTAETSFPETPQAVEDMLVSTGFAQVRDHAKNTTPTPPGGEPPQDNVAMGDDMPERRANVGRAVADGQLIPMMVTARKPA